MTNLSVFDFEGYEIRWVDEKPVANDVAQTLGFKDPANAVNRLVKTKNKSVCKIQTVDGKRRDVTVLEEAGIYQLIFSSKLKSAEKFQDWVFEEVLPSIRKTGSYGLKGNKKAIARSEGKEHRTELEDAIKAYIEAHPELSDNAKRWMYKNATDTIYRQVYAATAAKLVEALGCDCHHLRDQLSFKELAALTSIEGTAARLIEQLDMHPVDAIVEAVERTLLVGKFKEMHSQPALKEGK